MNFYISQYWTIILILVACQHVVNVSGINMFMKSSVSWSVLARYTLLGFRQKLCSAVLKFWPPIVSLATSNKGMLALFP